jgi:hypothetical protein
MNYQLERTLSVLLPVWLALHAPVLSQDRTTSDPVIVQIRVLQGEGAVYLAGSRAKTGLTVEVTDEIGRPVEDTMVSFRLPPKGPSGVFPNGLTSDVVVTGADGRATVSGVKWNLTPGPVQIRITAAKGEARAGLIVSQSLAESRASRARASATARSFKPRRKWLTATLFVAGAAAGATAVGLAFGRRSSSAPAPPAVGGLSIGAPTITIGGPK